MFYTYIHIRASDNKPFYIGKGCKKRAWSLQRSVRWHRVVKKHGFHAEILCYFDKEEDAFEHERFLIKCFKDMNIDLINATDGGEGLSGFNHSDYTKQKISKKHGGKKLTQEHKLKLSIAKQGSNHPNFGKRHKESTIEKLSKSLAGRKFSDETKQKMSSAKKGSFATEETLKKLSAMRLGTKWHTNGITNIRLKPSDEVPDGFYVGRTYKTSEETKRKISNALKKRTILAVLGG